MGICAVKYIMGLENTINEWFLWEVSKVFCPLYLLYFLVRTSMIWCYRCSDYFCGAVQEYLAFCICLYLEQCMLGLKKKKDLGRIPLPSRNKCDKRTYRQTGSPEQPFRCLDWLHSYMMIWCGLGGGREVCKDFLVNLVFTCFPPWFGVDGVIVLAMVGRSVTNSDWCSRQATTNNNGE